MKSLKIFAGLIILLSLWCCNKDNDLIPDRQTLTERSEEYLSLKSGESIYSDSTGNEYYTFSFNPDTTERVFSVRFEAGKKYYLTVSGEQAYFVDMKLLNSARDTLFFGETADIPIMKKYVVWESDEDETMFILVRYTDDINFHTFTFHLTFEELTTHSLYWNDFILECSGDWLINSENFLMLACHNTAYVKWARIVDNSLFNYDFSCSIGLLSGIPDLYTGIGIYGSELPDEMFNMPACYEVKILGPASWERWIWNGFIAREWGNTPTSLNRGEGMWNTMRVTTLNDYIEFYVNEVKVTSFNNVYFMDNGLYLTVMDTKSDTVFFKDLILDR